MLYMADVAKTAVTSKFDLYCTPLSAQRAGMANTRDAPTNLISEVCMEQPMLSKAVVLYQVPRVNQPFI